MKRSVALIAPYAAWMALMSLLPQTAWAYALRGAITAGLLIAGWFGSKPEKCARARASRASLVGLLVGVLVLVVWIAPEPWLFVSSSSSPSPYAPETCGWPLTIAKLCASAFVISVAEELFFRKWLVEFAGFGWMLILFGVEHMRWDLGLARGSVFIAEGVFAGFCYGIIAKKYGILSAIIAHAVTNLLLGFYVIFANRWYYW